MNTDPRSIDIEITNRCNALCTFCPRDKMPPLGQMKLDTYKRILERIVEYGRQCIIHFAGFGEPVMHPQLPDFVSRASALGIRTGINTNAALLTESMTHQLLNAGLSKITFNVAALGEDYDEIYNLDFGNTLRNIDFFLGENAGQCEIWMSIVENDLNRGRIKNLKQYWKQRGIQNFFVAKESNRAGALPSALYFHQDMDGYYRERAAELLRDRGVEVECRLPKTSVFISQEGDYYLCCQDWRKQLPLGSVLDYSFEAMDAIKARQMQCGNTICAQCDFDPINMVRDALMRLDQGDGAAEDLEAKVVHVHRMHEKRHFEFPRV